MKLATVAVMTTMPVCSAAPTARAITGEELCQSMKWPMPLPPTVGYSLMHLSNDSILQCFDNVKAIAPDGHDAMNDPARDANTWKIASMNPSSGTMVPRDQQINLTVVHDDNAPS